MTPPSQTIERLERELILHNRAMSASSCGITIVDARAKDLPLIYVNEAFEKICGYKLEEVLGKNCRFLQGPFRDESTISKIHHAIEHREHLGILLKNFRKDGTLFWNKLNLSPIFDEDGELTHFVGIQTDVTEREEVRAELLKRTAQLEKAYDALKELNAHKDRLIGIVAHDLRGPLGNISSLLELSVEATDQSERDEMVRISMEIAEKALGLLNDLLDVSAIKTGKLEIKKQQTDLKSFFDAINKTSQRCAALKGITFEAKTEFLVSQFSFDPNRIEQVLNNLVGNAIKFSHRGSKIILSVRSAKDSLTIAVTDEGQGIKESEVSNLFGEFVKTSTQPTESETSTGLGLSICKRITELHGGTISARSEFGQGATFSVKLDS